MKDLFSHDSNLYAKYRPTYPDSLFDFIAGLSEQHSTAWDCGTGNGQLASKLSAFFDVVQATDISAQQLEHAVRKNNIHYSVQAAEHSSFPDQYFDLIIVAQAIHWFQFNSFYNEVYRVMKPNGIFMVTGYGTLRINPKIDSILHHFHEHTLDGYWDPERKYVDESYTTIPFPFTEITCPDLYNSFHWSLSDLEGYINTWSAVKKFIHQNQTNPVPDLMQSLRPYWELNNIMEVQFPLLLRAGTLTSNF